MFDDDLEPQKKKPVLKNLEKMSVDELKVYIADMKTEIERADAEIARKQAHMNAAATFFKTGK